MPTTTALHLSDLMDPHALDSIERWITIPDHPNYEVSDLGRVRRRTPGRGTRPGLVLKPIPNPPMGRLYVKPRTGGRTHQVLVHRLVLMSFVGPPPEGRECCHRDGDCTNNRLTNLYWGTRSDNVRDAMRHGTWKAPRRWKK